MHVQLIKYLSIWMTFEYSRNKQIFQPIFINFQDDIQYFFQQIFANRTLRRVRIDMVVGEKTTVERRKEVSQVIVNPFLFRKILLLTFL